jgi:hypothetical protein
MSIAGAICYAMLCYAMLCYAMLCYAMLCYAMLCYAMLCYAITRDTQDSLDNYNECASISDKGK